MIFKVKFKQASFLENEKESLVETGHIYFRVWPFKFRQVKEKM